MTGVLLNVATVILGTFIGVVFGRLIAERLRQVVFFAIGSCTIGLGAVIAVGGFGDLGATKVGSLAAVVLVVSLVAGSLCGEALRIEERLEGLGGLMHRLASRSRSPVGGGGEGGGGAVASSEGGGEGDGKGGGTEGGTEGGGEGNARFAEGFVAASVFFCVGAMTVMGSLQAGLGDPSTLYLKSVLDGVTSVALATGLGVGVGASAVTVFAVEGGLVLLAGLAGPYVTPAMIASIELVGGIMLIALGIEIIGIKKLKAGNMLPSLVAAVILGGLLGQ
ncbi:MAG: DUF554 domain-containing protein [Coriobacteriales bacterium]|nr:DUF554 domain-containing protein [Coriobacteriales bacterium]